MRDITTKDAAALALKIDMNFRRNFLALARLSRIALEFVCRLEFSYVAGKECHFLQRSVMMLCEKDEILRHQVAKNKCW